jgi:hypothetical protein
MKGSEIEVGMRLWEDCGVGEPYSAGRVVALSESSDRPGKVYALLEDDDGSYTVYSIEMKYSCKPRLARSVPREDFEYMVRKALEGVDLPEESNFPKGEAKKKVISKPVESAKKVILPTTNVNVEADDNVANLEESDSAVDEGLIVEYDGESINFGNVQMGFDVTMSVV